MASIFLNLCWLIIFLPIVASRVEPGLSRKSLFELTQYIKSAFPSKHINIFYDLSSRSDSEEVTREHFLRDILSQKDEADAAATDVRVDLQTFNLVSNQANASHILPAAWSKLTATGHFHEQHTGCSALNLLLFDGENSDTLFNLLGKLEDFIIKPSNDQTLVYQWKNYNSDILYNAALKNMKYRAEVIPTSSGLNFRSFCFYCATGEPNVINLPNSPLKTTELFPDTTRNLGGKHLKFSMTFGMPTIIDIRRTADGSWEYFAGFGTPFLNSLKRKHNFNLTIEPTRGFGIRLPNGSFTGVLGLVVNEDVDFGIAGIWYIGHFSVDYLHFVQPGTVVVSTRVPADALRLHAIFQAFGYRSWCLLIAVNLGILLPFYIFLRKFAISFEGQQPESRITTFHKGIQFIFHPLLEQTLTTDNVPTQHSGRIFLAFWLYAVLVILTAYKSKLRDLMILSEPEYIPTTFEELAELPEYELYAQNFGGLLFPTFSSLKPPVYKNVAKRLRPTDTMVECLEYALYRPKAVCINYGVVIQRESNLHFTDRMGRPRIRVSSDEHGAFTTCAVLVTKKNHILENTLNSFSSMYYSMGLTQHGNYEDMRESASKGKKKAMEKSDTSIEQNTYSDGGPAPLKLKHFHLVFLLLITGLIVGFVVLQLERIVFRRKRRNNIVRRLRIKY